MFSRNLLILAIAMQPAASLQQMFCWVYRDPYSHKEKTVEIGVKVDGKDLGEQLTNLQGTLKAFGGKEYNPRDPREKTLFDQKRGVQRQIREIEKKKSDAVVEFASTLPAFQTKIQIKAEEMAKTDEGVMQIAFKAAKDLSQK